MANANHRGSQSAIRDNKTGPGGTDRGDNFNRGQSGRDFDGAGGEVRRAGSSDDHRTGRTGSRSNEGSSKERAAKGGEHRGGRGNDNPGNRIGGESDGQRGGNR